MPVSSKLILRMILDEVQCMHKGVRKFGFMPNRMACFCGCMDKLFARPLHPKVEAIIRMVIIAMVT